jgi:FAD:protein FMN transferase
MKILSALQIICSLLVFSACSKPTPTNLIAGSIFGTSYNIKIVAPIATDKLASLQTDIHQRLEKIDASMSSWRSDSQINLFNKIPVNQWMQVSPDTYQVIKLAQQMSELTAGNFDITIAPLVKLWGFKSYKTMQQIPTDAQIKQALTRTGFAKLQLDDTAQSLLKTAPISIDVAAIAKGYAVDVVAELLLTRGYQHHLVEIGGEIKVHGKRADGSKWRLAIEQPQEVQGSIAQIVNVTNAALATSGDYRNYVRLGNKRYSHSIDPLTGYPISHNVASVTVIASSSARADALATALTIMGATKGLEFANKHRLAVFFILRGGSEFKTVHSAEFTQYL